MNAHRVEQVGIGRPSGLVVQVVRRFGPVGGMEAYVWHLSHELAKLGILVVVLCEAQAAEPTHPGVRVIALVRRWPARPRWWAYLGFARAVRQRLQEPDLLGALVHSHERCSGHDITTFHSEPFCGGQPPRGLQRLSPRHWINHWMERRELGLNGHPVRVAPVSARVSHLLVQAYPDLAGRLEHPLAPSVEAPRSMPAARACQTESGVVGFMGREWKRKGLPLALRIVAQLR